MSRNPLSLGALACLLFLGQAGWAPDVIWGPMSNEGVVRASRIVDSVFLDGTAKEAEIAGGDFASYLIARLGVRPIPPDLRFMVGVDTAGILLRGTMADLPEPARVALGPVFMFLPLEAMVQADIGLLDAGPRAVRFNLRSVSIEGVAIPETILQGVMSQIGRQYPALTSSGRDLYVEIPSGAHIRLVPNRVRLIAP